MTKKYSTKKALITSVLSLVLCFSMLLGTTFAWFTDSVSSENNIIQSGKLDVEMYWAEGVEDPATANWADASTSAIFDYEKWEPGYVQVRHIKIENKGSLALQYKLMIVANGEVTDLSDVIDVYYLDPAAQITDRTQLSDNNKLGTLTEVLANLDSSASGYLAKGDDDTVTIALKMQETAGNDYQEKSLCDGGFSVRLIATQAAGEFDSFGDDYDKNAVADFFPGFQGGSASIGVTLDDQRYTTTEVTIECGDIVAVIPAGVKLAEGYSSLQLDVALKNSSDSNVQLNENEKMRPSDVHIEGVARDNTTPMFITLKHYLTTGVNAGAIKMYHVENGVTVPMTYAANLANHNEFNHDPLTGDVTLALASFSETAVVVDTTNPWDGETETAYSGSGTEADPYLIASADQLAYFRTQVDNGNSFEGKVVKLNNNIYLSGKDFDPIGWGYVNTEWNRNGVDGMVFKGTFDGGQYENGKLVGRYTIFDLHQSGWDLEDPDGDGVQNADYTYTNCGFGLFAAASDATFKNLTISGAYVRVECVEAGVLVGLSQNSCTYQNIKILNSKIANYQRPAGGLIGEVSGDGTTTITDVTIGSDVVVGSLWGDFDAPCGGVIGAYWNDVNANPQIVMTDVEVGCRMDVYNDITSAYQWHAYRRAGMLIGNTDMSDPNNAHKAYAPFLTCTKDAEGKPTVKVYYGDWVNYTYCSFSNHNDRYPWVRTQAGENCTAFSNPRWGVPNDAAGNRVTDMNHVHTEGDKGNCGLVRQFSQLYGGGQGVYGQDTHDGVEVCESYYSITYVNDGQTLDVIYVTDNTNPFDVANDQAEKLVKEWATKNMKDYNDWSIGGWMNAASIRIPEIPEGNTKDVVLYPYFTSPYTASFVDQTGNILAWCFFNEVNINNLPDAYALANEKLPNPGDDFKLIEWKIRGIDKNDKEFNTTLTIGKENWESFKGYKDVTITPHYRYSGADLIEVYDELTGEIDHYQVAGYGGGVASTIVEIPAYVNGKPVTIVNADAFSSYDDLHSVRIPGTITKLNYQSFTANQGSSWNPKRDTVTLYYEGDPAVWNAAMEDYNNRNITENSLLQSGWDNMMGDGSRVFFLDENGKVINTMYWELNEDFDWVLHEHAYSYEAAKNCSHGEKSHYEYGGGFIGIGASLQKDKFTNYAGNCDCGCGVRPDAEYWN